MTLDQIETIADERRRGERHWHAPLSLKQAARKAALPFRQCDTCHGAGFTKATLLDTPKQLHLLAQHDPNGSPHIAYDRCPRCDGAGGFVG